MEAAAACSDADTLDMEGFWELTQSFSVDVPPELLPYTSVFKVKLGSAGAGSHGGMLFEGSFVSPRDPGRHVLGRDLLPPARRPARADGDGVHARAVLLLPAVLRQAHQGFADGRRRMGRRRCARPRRPERAVRLLRAIPPAPDRVAAL